MNATRHESTKTVNRNASPRLAMTLCILAMIVAGRTTTAFARGEGLQSQSREAKIDQRITRISTAIQHAEQAGHDHGDCSKCVELTEMSVLFDSDADTDDVAEMLGAMPDEQLDAFQPQGSTWTYTATDGNVFPGQTITITYSFVPDGTPITVSGYPGDDPSELFAKFDSNFPGGQTAWKAAFNDALNRWGQLINVQYVEVADDGVAFGVNTFGQLGARGDVRIAMRPLGAALAVNYYPQFGGDMILDSNDVFTLTNSANNFRALRNTIMHEHGHGLGLRHVMPTDGTKLMEPFLNTNFDGPQEDDIRGGQRLYGDWAEYNDEFTNNEFLADTLSPVTNAGVITQVVDDVALEGNSASDWYGFGCDNNTPIAIRLEPVGTTYNQAPQDDPTNTTTVNGKAARDLGIRLYRRTSISNNHIGLLAEIDLNDAGEGEYHPPITYPATGYMLIEVYSADGIDDVQRYRLTVSNAAIDAVTEPEPQTAPAISVFDITGGSEVFDGTVVQFGPVQVGQSAGRSLTIVNAGDGTLELGQPTLAGPGAADYGFTLLQSTVAPAGTANLSIAFSPQAAGVRQAVLTLPSNDPLQPDFGFILSGLGTPAPEADMIVERDGEEVTDGEQFGDELFPATDAGESSTVEFTIRNVGTAGLSLGNLSVNGPDAQDFDVALDDTFLPANSNQVATLSVTFTAPIGASGGQHAAEVSFTSNDSDEPTFTISLAASSVEPNDDNGGENNGDENDDDENDDDEDDDNEDEENEVENEDTMCGTGGMMTMMFGSLCLCGAGGLRRRRRA